MSWSVSDPCVAVAIRIPMQGFKEPITVPPETKILSNEYFFSTPFVVFGIDTVKRYGDLSLHNCEALYLKLYVTSDAISVICMELGFESSSIKLMEELSNTTYAGVDVVAIRQTPAIEFSVNVVAAEIM